MNDNKDQDNYKSPTHPFYFNRKDKRVFVPKLVGSGVTFNFGHWAAWLIILVLVLFPFAIMYLIK